jgi:hypothetical protein
MATLKKEIKSRERLNFMNQFPSIFKGSKFRAFEG